MGYAKRLLENNMKKSSTVATCLQANGSGITYEGLLKDASRVNQLRKEEHSLHGNSTRYAELAGKLDRIAAVGYTKYHIDTEQFYCDMYNMIARYKRRYYKKKAS